MKPSFRGSPVPNLSNMSATSKHLFLRNDDRCVEKFMWNDIVKIS